MELCYRCFKEYSGGKAVCPHCGYDAAADEGKYPHALRPGSILGGSYIVGRVLGQGGFGITYAALDYNSKELVAIKEFMPTMLAARNGHSHVSVYGTRFEDEYSTHKKNFLEEAKIISQFNGMDGVCDIYSYFEENGTAYFSMEYVDGISLGKYMESHGRLTVEQAMGLLLPAMRVLDHIHSKGLIHRDIAPDNIMIDNKGKVYLIDFGAARYSMGEVSQSLDIVIKHGFAPKEQYARHGRQGPFTDVYAMAATFYYAITGRKPPDAMDRDECDGLQPPATLGVEINGEAEKVLLKALSPRAADRYQRMAEFALEFTRAVYGASDEKDGAGDDQTPDDDTSFDEDEEIWLERRPGFSAGKKIALVALALCLVLAILLGTGGKKISASSKNSNVSESAISHETEENSSKLKGIWSGDDVYLRHGLGSRLFELESPVKNCAELTLNIKVNSYTGYPFDEWYLYARDTDGNWDHIAMFNLPEDLTLKKTLSYTLKFEKPQSFDALSICHVYDGYVFSLDYDLYYTDVKLG